nr:DNA-directed DNA polymerase [Tanacetum cinerariifolium]
MEELLQAPTEGYGEAIVIPEIKADHFEIKTNLLQLVQANPYHGFKRENPHTHIINFKRITSTLKFRDVPNYLIKLMMFLYSLEGSARVCCGFKADPRVPFILGRSFLGTSRALIDIYREEITLRVNDEAVIFNLNQTTRYSPTYDDLSVNRIDIIDVTREDYAQEILGFSKNSSGGNPTSTSEPILSNSSPSVTPFEGSDFILEEIEAYLKDESISLEINNADYDLKQGEVVTAKSLIEEPLKLDLKDLPSHLEYAYLEGKYKLPVIIAKDLKDNEKEALLKVLKSHKKAIAWKITDIKGNDPRFCTHKILMEEDYKPTVQSQRRVNPKIHEVIKKEVIKLLDAGMIYPISDSPWVSPIHCVPKKGGITIDENENNELIPTRCMMAIFHYTIEKTMEVFMDDFSVFRNSFKTCLSHLDKMLKRCEDTNLCLNWEKSHFMIKEGIVLGHKISNNGIKVDKAKVDLQLNELNELRDQAYENSLIYKEKTKKLHESKIKNRIFNVGDRVLLFNSRLKIFSRRLKTRWSGTFTITKVFPYGTVELSQPDGPNFKEEIHLIESLLYDNSSSQLPKEHNAEEERIKRERADYISLLLPPPEPPDAEFDFESDVGKEIPVVMNKKDEFDVSNDENDDYFPFMFVIRIFLPYLICSRMFISFLSAESEDTIFDPGFNPQWLKFLVFGYLFWFTRSSHPLIEISLGSPYP